MEINNNIKNTAPKKLYHWGTVFPIAFCMFACSGIGTVNGIIISLFLSLFSEKNNASDKMPLYLNFLIITYVYNSFGGTVAAVSIAVSGIMLCFASLFADKMKSVFSSPAVPAIMLATALSVTVMQTTQYFGIGASGNTVVEMIASYRSLGFHPNWRGVLYGTITMVIMITFPRKFKSFSKTIHPSLIALVVTLTLNYALNPADMISSISEVGKPGFQGLINSNNTALSDFMGANLPIAVVCAIALFISNTYMLSTDEEATKNDYVYSGLINIPFAFWGAFMPVKASFGKTFENIKNGIFSFAIILIVSLVFPDNISRIPLHSCAVVLIVGAWQSVRWGEIKKVFSNFGSIVCFTVVIAAALLTNIVSGVLIAAIVAIIYSAIKSKVFKISN